MKIIAQGVLNAGEANTSRAIGSFPQVVALASGKLLASYRSGSGKDHDDNNVEIRSSTDLGATWSEPRRPWDTTIDSVRGSIGAAKMTEVEPGRLLAAIMWVDRERYPGKPLFNAETEGCLPMRIFVSESRDEGESWSQLRGVDVPEDLGPPSLTSPILVLPSGRLALSLESNKDYLDTSPWLQEVQYVYSNDSGATWGEPRVISKDPTGRIFNWDQRTGVTSDGAVVSFTWTYDSKEEKYLNIHRRISRDDSVTWTEPEDLGFSDQASVPAIFPDGRVVLAWVDRFGSQSIRARMSERVDSEFTSQSEVVLWDEAGRRREIESTGELLADMGEWNYGLPYCTALPNGEALAVFYAGGGPTLDVHWVRLAL